MTIKKIPLIVFLLAALSATAQQAPAPAPNAAASNKPHPAIFKSDSREITLTPGQGIELKYHMPKDAALIYSWKSTGVVQFEFHGEPDVKPDPKYYDSYQIDDKDGKTEGHGSFIAPSTGIHGWYWKNIGQQDVTVHLKAAGFFDGIKFFSRAGVQEFPVQDAK